MIILVTGPARSGKDHFARYCANKALFTQLRFAGGLKNSLRVILESAGETKKDINRRMDGDLKETPCKTLNYKTPRYAMQTLGTEWGRMLIGVNFWAMITATKAVRLAEEGQPVVIPDCRFDNEWTCTKALADAHRIPCYLVERRHTAQIESTHASEAGLDPQIPRDCVFPFYQDETDAHSAYWAFLNAHGAF